jgi:hypothetical protein
MKKVVYHWVEMQALLVPDEAPTDNIDDLFCWINDQGKKIKHYAISNLTRDCELIDVAKTPNPK